MMDIFRKYTNELEQIQTIYEENKVIYVHKSCVWEYIYIHVTDITMCVVHLVYRIILLP